jgi:8-oxo-dGTP pyrophosphatase MutT (NUDIX family)
MLEIPAKAVCVIVYNEDRKVLTVTRRHTDIISLPGGKVDLDEEPIDAAVRETFEETGIELDKRFLEPVYSQVVPGDVVYYSVAFCYNKLLPSSDKVWSVEEGIVVSFETVTDLLTKGCFSEYNKAAFTNIDRILKKV